MQQDCACVLIIEYIMDGNKTPRFNEKMTILLKILLMSWKRVAKMMVIVLTNTNLLMTKSAIPVTFTDRWCCNVDATTIVELCTLLYCFVVYYPFSLYLDPKTCYKHQVSDS